MTPMTRQNGANARLPPDGRSLAHSAVVNWLDGVAIVVLVLAALVGSGRGFFAPAFGLAGALAGLLAGLLLAEPLTGVLAPVEQPWRAVIGLAALAALVVAGEGIGVGIGAGLARGLPHGVRRPIDVVGGIAVGLAHGVFFIWLVGGILAAGAPQLAQPAHNSAVLRQLYAVVPPPGLVAGRLLAVFQTSELPRLFAGLEPPPAAPVDLPDDARSRALAESAVPTTVQVIANGCPYTQAGSGFFIGPTEAVTNAHVVAGATDTTVTLGEATMTATVVLFDSDADLALLHVAEADAPALELSGATPQRGTTGVVVGFPLGGPLRVEAAGVTASFEAQGPDIYGEQRAVREVVELRTEIQQGNSGGPLVTEEGVAGGVVFGASRSQSGYGYALAAPFVADRLAAGRGATAGVDTGPCR